MEFALPNISLTFEVTFSNPSLPAAMSVYDTTGMSPVLVSGPTAMPNIVGNTYYGKFTASNNKSYVILKAVYTDDTFETLDPNYSQGSESIVVTNEGIVSSCQLIGVLPDCGSFSCANGVFEIFTGEDKTMNMGVVYEKGGGPLDLTNCSEISVALSNADSTFTNLLLSMSQVVINGNPLLGSFSAIITHTVSALLNVAVLQSIDVTFTISGKISIVRFFQAFSVLEST